MKIKILNIFIKGLAGVSSCKSLRLTSASEMKDIEHDIYFEFGKNSF